MPKSSSGNYGPRSFSSAVLHQNEIGGNKHKNIQQTELLMDLRDAVLQIARHFQTHDPSIGKIVRTRTHCTEYCILRVIATKSISYFNER